jgi:hypothetical protein
MKREFDLTIEIDTETKQEATDKIKKLFKVISIKHIGKRRTTQQNRALHLYFTLLAVALNDAGFDMKKTISRDIDIMWTPYNIKEYLWKPLQKEIIGQKSTAQLKTEDIDKVFDVLNKVIGERTGVYVPFPSIEELMKLDEENI